MTNNNIDWKVFSEKSISLVGLSYILIVGILSAASAALKLFQKWIHDSYKIVKLENTLMHTELDLLKANISPHFLFNMLNNSEVLIQTDPLKARQIIGKLSEFLRYQLYDSRRDSVLLNSDIKFINHFLDLERIRRDFFEYSIEQIEIHNHIEIPPLIFIAFVENAVKHTIHSEKGSYVNIRFELIKNNLVFTCRNSIGNEDKNKELNSGFGLPNVKKRLDLLFPKRYILHINKENGEYLIQLTINL